MMKALKDPWDAFCGQSDCLSSGGKGCSFGAIISPSSCVNHVAVISIDAFLLSLFLLSLAWKGLSRRTRSRFSSGYFSPLVLSSALLNGFLGAAYLGLGAWTLGDELRKGKDITPLHRWIMPLFQGLTWVIVCPTMSVRARQLGRAFLGLWLAAAAVLAGFLCISSVLDVVAVRAVTFKSALGMLSLPGAFLLIMCALKGSQNAEIDHIGDETLHLPLNGECDETVVDSSSFVTPFANAGFLSKHSFWWLNTLMKKGCEKPLEDKDIPLVRETDQAKTRYCLFMEQLNKQKEARQITSPSIFWTIIHCHLPDIFISGFYALLKILTLSSGPVLLNTFIKLAESDDSSQIEGCLLALSLFVVKCLESIAQRQWYFRSRTLGLQLRSLLSAAIYQKQLRLSNSAKVVHSSGEIMNYVTVDAYRIGEFPFYLHQTWTTILQLCIALVILYNVVGLATIASLIVIVLTVLCNTPLAKLQHKFQTKLMGAQDERLKNTGEALVNMKVLKLYAWETHFKAVIEGLRKVELKWLSAFNLRRAYNSFLFWSSPVLVSVATFVACYFLHIPLDASNVFTFVATLRLVQDPVRSIPDVIGVVIQAKVAFTRIINFLDAPELHNQHIRKKYMNSLGHPIVINSASFSWDENFTKPTLRNINVEVKHKDKVAICGEVGSGKSTLLAAILGEIPNIEGMIQVNGKIAYVSQTAWIPTGTIRENILFGSAMDKTRYHETLEKCSLVRDLDMLPFGDLTEIGERGVNLSGGQKQRLQLARALYQDADIYLLDDPFSAVDAHTATSLFNDYVMGALSEKTVLLVTHQVDFLPAFDTILLMSDGEILSAATYFQLMDSSNEFQELVNAHRETMGSEKLDKPVLNHKNETATGETKNMYAKRNQKTMKESPGDQLIKKEEREMGDTGMKPYMLYLNQNKGFLYLALGALSHIVFIGGQIAQNSWMAANVQNPQVSQLRLIIVYLAIGCSTVVFLLFRSMAVVILGVETSKSLFSQLLNSLFRAPMSFYDSTPLGRILSRVSADMSIVDLDVPFSFMFSLAATLNAYSNLGVLAAITWQVLFVSIPVVYLTIRLQRYYLGSAKQMMRINGTTKSLVANHLAESVAGVVTIRAFQEEDRFFSKNLEHIDRNASPFFHNFAASEWLIQRLETMSAVVLSSSALFMVLLPKGTFSSGFIGMALSYGLSLNMSLVFSIQNQCILTNYIISVERLNQYMHIPSEAPEIIDNNRPPSNWPAVGRVDIQDLKIRYRPDTPLVLHGITCTFEGGHKIGIVGRTGSGKTTLIGALFRLVEPAGGKILIDELDIATIGLHDLRSRFAIIPQDPTLFNGTVRYNLDPLGKHTDKEIWEVLEKCQLHEAVQDKKRGLDSLVIEDGSNWSLGQRQLFCLCRALLRRSRILVLDEATASIDNATDLILQKTIRSEFVDSTVITVAHRIPTVMDCTMVLVVSDGKLVEFDKPKKLIQLENSFFGQLVREYWSHTVNADIDSAIPN